MVENCCDWMGTSNPGTVSSMWFESDPQGRVYVLGPAELSGASRKPTRIHNVLSPAAPVVSPAHAFECRPFGELAPRHHSNEPVLSVVVEQIGSELVPVCRLGRLYSDPGDSAVLHFFPCGAQSSHAFQVRPEQVAALIPPFPPGMEERCLTTGAAPGHVAAPGSGTPTRRRVRDEALGALTKCARTAATLTAAVQKALTIAESSSSSAVSRRHALDRVKEEIEHAKDFASSECLAAAGAFVAKAEPLVCLAEANEALRAEGHEAIPMGASEQEDIAHMRAIANRLAHTDGSSRAVGVLSSCLGHRPHPSSSSPLGQHARTRLDASCGALPELKGFLDGIHQARPEDRQAAVERLDNALDHLPSSRRDAAVRCKEATEVFSRTASDDHCRKVLGARRPEDIPRAALDLLSRVRHDGQIIGCEEYECLRQADDKTGTRVAESALEESSVLRNAHELLPRVRDACGDPSTSGKIKKLLSQAETHLSGEPEWTALVQEAEREKKDKCALAASAFMAGAADAYMQAARKCGSPEYGNLKQSRAAARAAHLREQRAAHKKEQTRKKTTAKAKTAASAPESAKKTSATGGVAWTISGDYEGSPPTTKPSTRDHIAEAKFVAVASAIAQQRFRSRTDVEGFIRSLPSDQKQQFIRGLRKQWRSGAGMAPTEAHPPPRFDDPPTTSSPSSSPATPQRASGKGSRHEAAAGVAPISSPATAEQQAQASGKGGLLREAKPPAAAHGPPSVTSAIASTITRGMSRTKTASPPPPPYPPPLAASLPSPNKSPSVTRVRSAPGFSSIARGRASARAAPAPRVRSAPRPRSITRGRASGIAAPAPRARSASPKNRSLSRGRIRPPSPDAQSKANEPPPPLLRPRSKSLITAPPLPPPDSPHSQSEESDYEGVLQGIRTLPTASYIGDS